MEKSLTFSNHSKAGRLSAIILSSACCAFFGLALSFSFSISHSSLIISAIVEGQNRQSSGRSKYMAQVYTFESGAFFSQGHNSMSLPVSGLVQIFPLLTYSAILGLNTSQYSTSSADADSWPLLYLMQHLPHELHSLIVDIL